MFPVDLLYMQKRRYENLMFHIYYNSFHNDITYQYIVKSNSENAEICMPPDQRSALI